VGVSIDQTGKYVPSIATGSHPTSRTTILDPSVDYEQVIASLLGEENARIPNQDIHNVSEKCIGTRKQVAIEAAEFARR
jgi:hypothetical protein